MEFKLKTLSIYEFGQRKDKDGNPHQEDWIYPALGNVNNEKDRLFILCDGMGGHAAGEVASAAVCEAMSKTINSGLEKGEKFSERLLLDAIDAAYDLLDKRDTTEGNEKKMGTTMTFLMLHEGGATIAHIGDSRVYHIRPKNGKKEDIVFCTKDHSLVNDLIKIGELTEEEALNYPQKNVITRAMQPNQEHRHKADIVTKRNIRPGDYFYMCSDGMLEQTSDDNLCFILANDVSDEEKRDMLIRVSKNNHDNHSAHIIHILDVQPEAEIEDDLLPLSLSSINEIDDEDLVNPDFDNSDIAKDTSVSDNNENVPISNEEVIEQCEESIKQSLPKFSDSTSIEVGTDASNIFPGEQETINNCGRGNKFIWRICACIAIAILAFCGVIFSNFPKKEKIESHSDREICNQRNHNVKSDRINSAHTPANNPKSSSHNKEQTGINTTNSNEHNPVPSKVSGNQSTTHEPPSQEESAVTTSPTSAEQTNSAQHEAANNSSRTKKVEKAINNRTDTQTENAVSSDENKVQKAENKKKKK